MVRRRYIGGRTIGGHGRRQGVRRRNWRLEDEEIMQEVGGRG